MAARQRLTAKFVRNAPPGKHGDGRGSHGLRLVVSPKGSRSWVQRLTVQGRLREIGLGPYPIVGLAKARRIAFDNARKVHDGIDPLAEKRRGDMPTFEQAAAETYAILEPTWRNAKHAGQWMATLRRHAFPHIGDKPVGDIETADVMRVLTPIWNTRPETARRVRQRLGAVLKWAIAHNYRTDNPAGDAIGAVLPKNERKKKHQRAIPHAEVAAAIAAVQASGAFMTTKLALEFTVLTAARSGEVRNATTDELDLVGRVWTIPGSRMKAGREHRVPLSHRALEVIAEAQSLSDPSNLVFPSSRRGRPISDMTLVKLLRTLDIDSTVHGFRSSFRDWCGERAKVPREVAEAALAHAVGDRTEAAYARSDLFERRRPLMEAWARYLAGDAAVVVPLRARQ